MKKIIKMRALEMFCFCAVILLLSAWLPGPVYSIDMEGMGELRDRIAVTQETDPELADAIRMELIQELQDGHLLFDVPEAAEHGANVPEKPADNLKEHEGFERKIFQDLGIRKATYIDKNLPAIESQGTPDEKTSKPALEKDTAEGLRYDFVITDDRKMDIINESRIDIRDDAKSSETTYIITIAPIPEPEPDPVPEPEPEPDPVPDVNPDPPPSGGDGGNACSKNCPILQD